MKNVTNSTLIISVSIFLIAFGNFAFFSNVLNSYPLNLKNSLFLLSLVIVFGCFIIILLSLLCYKQTTKPVLITILLISSFSAYFMDSYNVIIDDVMIDNIIKTDLAESMDLVSFKQFIYFFLLGIIPSLVVYKIPVTASSHKKSVINSIKLIGTSSVIVVAIILLFGGFYASFIREHTPLRFYANPSYYIYSASKYVDAFFDNPSSPLQEIGLDAKVKPSGEHRELMVFVVGETARADHFSLNGYARKTNPYLKNETVISFNNTWSCGTSTAVSVPCMFSIYNRSNYEKNKAGNTENVLDILHRAGVNVLWLDNNSDSKGVATRIPFEDYRTAATNPLCDIECRDMGMLSDLNRYIMQHPEGDIFIVLHQMGNHGPAYYKRYPAQFERFTPTCKTSQLEQCSQQEIINTYDNAILYSDYFLSQVIALLKQHDDQFESMMFYVSDHGESLGKNGLYLHGLPYIIAPDEQKHVPMIMWFCDNVDRNQVDTDSLQTKASNPYSHDNLFHTILGLMEITTTVYDQNMDIIDHSDSG
ncbi:MAG: phosphoethanolamine--lipid A transferase [Gammaproteobacteria bacterium]|nr:phosphoethanolamine--lipid A transferase [Gammaproteobacteria bacterium]